MVEQRSRRGADMMLGAGLILIGMVAGGALFSGPGASVYGAGEAAGASDCLPAISLGDVALAREAAGHYVIISSSGWARPVRVRDTDLRSSPGESFVFAP